MTKQIRCLSLALALGLALSPCGALAGVGYADYLTSRAIQEQEKTNNNRWMEIPGRGKMLYYAQTNPFWASMRYEEEGSRSFRRFGDAGCCPTSAAIVFANLLSVENLGLIKNYASKKAGGYGISTGIMNPLNMPRSSGIFWINAAEDFQKYLPLVFGQYAAGNNATRTSWRAKPREHEVSTGGTGNGFVLRLADLYGLHVTKFPGKGNRDWIPYVEAGGICLALANSQWQPFVNGKGHYVAIVGVDKDYLYVMDPQDKKQEAYDRDRNHVLDVMETGLIRVKRSDYTDLHFGLIYAVYDEQAKAKLDRHAAAQLATADLSQAVLGGTLSKP